MYDDVVLKAFLDNQLDLYPQKVADGKEEALDFLSEVMAAVCDSVEEVIEYLEDVGVDTEGMNEEEILDMPEIMPVGDGRYLILEV